MKDVAHPLLPYPDLETGFIGNVSACFRVDDSIHFVYVCKGNLDGILLPESAVPAFADGLWEHTCFEAFIANHGSSAYREFNFSPSGKWACYDFMDYRKASEITTCVIEAPQIRLSKAQDFLSLEATLPLSALPVLKDKRKSFQIGMSAVIEIKSVPHNLRSYWALAHPASRPDFHQRNSFILEASLP